MTCSQRHPVGPDHMTCSHDQSEELITCPAVRGHPVGADHMSLACEGGPMSFVCKMKERQEVSG